MKFSIFYESSNKKVYLQKQLKVKSKSTYNQFRINLFKKLLSCMESNFSDTDWITIADLCNCPYEVVADETGEPELDIDHSELTMRYATKLIDHFIVTGETNSSPFDVIDATFNQSLDYLYLCLNKVSDSNITGIEDI